MILIIAGCVLIIFGTASGFSNADDRDKFIFGMKLTVTGCFFSLAGNILMILLSTGGFVYFYVFMSIVWIILTYKNTQNLQRLMNQ